jgi:predicted phosphohydrolase
MTDEPQVRFWIDHGTEVAGLTATDFRIAMRERDMLRRENERLRAALEEIADVAHPPDMRSVNIARRALGR